MFGALKHYIRYKKEVLVKQRVLKMRRDEALTQQYFLLFIGLYVKKNADRHKGTILKEKVEYDMKHQVFYSWFRKYRTLKLSEKILKDRCAKIMAADTFRVWRMRHLQSKDFNFKHKLFCQRQRRRSLILYWTAFSERIEHLKNKADQNEAAKWCFRKNTT